MGTLTEAFYRRLHAFHEPTEEFYSKDEPRDKEGQWTVGGGRGGARPGPTAPTIHSGLSAVPGHRVEPTNTLRRLPFDGMSDGHMNKLAKKIYESDLGDGYRSKVVESSPGYDNTMYVRGYIYNGSKQVGAFERTLSQDKGKLTVYHDDFELLGSHQGKGVGDRFNSHAIAEYQALGVDRINLRAGLEVGGYAWARQGYRYDDEEGDSSRRSFLSRSLDKVDAQIKHVPAYRDAKAQLAKESAALRKAIDAGEDVQPVHIAALGEKYARTQVRDENGNEYTTWPGKHALLGSNWNGVFYFDAANPITAAATNLEHASLRTLEVSPALIAAVEEFFDKNQPRDKDGMWTVGFQHVTNPEGAEAIMKSGFSLGAPEWVRHLGQGVYLAEKGDEKSAKFYANQGNRTWKTAQVVEGSVSLSNPMFFDLKNPASAAWEFRKSLVEQLGGPDKVQTLARAEYERQQDVLRRAATEIFKSDNPEKFATLDMSKPEEQFYWGFSDKANEAFQTRLDTELHKGSIDKIRYWKTLATDLATVVPPKAPQYGDQNAHYTYELATLAQMQGYDGLVINTRKWGGWGGTQIVAFNPDNVRPESVRPYKIPKPKSIQAAASAYFVLCEHGSLTAACHSAACAPPPVGEGGSSKGPRGVPANPDLTDPQRTALFNWSREAYEDINNISRGLAHTGVALSESDASAAAAHLDEAFKSAAPTTEDIVVSRAVGFDFELSDRFTDKGFTSTSYGDLVMFEGEVILIRVPKGSKVLQIDLESEILLPRGGTFTLTAPSTEHTPAMYDYTAASGLTAAAVQFFGNRCAHGSLTAACHDASCAPPPVGVGGSRISPRYQKHLDRIEATYGKDSKEYAATHAKAIKRTADDEAAAPELPTGPAPHGTARHEEIVSSPPERYRDFTPDEAQALRDLVPADLAGRLRIRTNVIDLESILTNEYRTGHSTGHSGGGLRGGTVKQSPDDYLWRDTKEKGMFGDTLSGPVLYGYIQSDRNPAPTIGVYGSVALVLKDEYISRTTMTFGDSGSHVNPAPIALSDARSASDARVRTASTNLAPGVDYLEAQIHAPLTSKGISKIVVPKSMSPEDRETVQSLAFKAGIPVEIADAEVKDWRNQHGQKTGGSFHNFEVVVTASAALIRHLTCAHGSLTAACHSAACRPPGVNGGTGGSSPSHFATRIMKAADDSEPEAYDRSVESSFGPKGILKYDKNTTREQFAEQFVKFFSGGKDENMTEVLVTFGGKAVEVFDRFKAKLAEDDRLHQAYASGGLVTGNTKAGEYGLRLATEMITGEGATVPPVLAAAVKRYETAGSTHRAEAVLRGELAALATQAGQRLVDDPEVHSFVQLPFERLNSLLSAGRFKGMDETDTSGTDEENKGARLAVEQKWFGMDKSASNRPIYGYLWKGKGAAVLVEGEDYNTGESPSVNIGSSKASLSFYGDVAVRLKRDTRDRTTVTFGDSFANQGELAPVPINNVNANAMGVTSPWVVGAHDINDHGSHWTTEVSPAYVEIQVHHGVSVRDIESVVIPRMYQEPQWSSTIRAVENSGVPIEWV